MAKEFAFTRDTTLQFNLADGNGTYSRNFKKGETIFGEAVGSDNRITQINFTMSGGYERYTVIFTPEETEIFFRVGSGEVIPLTLMPVLIWKDSYNKISESTATGPSAYTDKTVMEGNKPMTEIKKEHTGLKKYLTNKNLLIAGGIIAVIGFFYYIKK